MVNTIVAQYSRRYECRNISKTSISIGEILRSQNIGSSYQPTITTRARPLQRSRRQPKLQWNGSYSLQSEGSEVKPLGTLPASSSATETNYLLKVHTNTPNIHLANNPWTAISVTRDKRFSTTSRPNPLPTRLNLERYCDRKLVSDKLNEITVIQPSSRLYLDPYKR